MKSIENYWEQALLRLLLQRKTKEISGIVHVYDNEIEEYYRNSGETLPLSEVHSDIRRLIRQRKETELMNAWIEELKKKSYVKINIYKTHDGLDSAYEELFNEPNQAPSFYIYKTNTIYTVEDIIDERILAHEMAHCIIDHYFVVLPPRKIQEILAVYADVHLNNLR